MTQRNKIDSSTRNKEKEILDTTLENGQPSLETENDTQILTFFILGSVIYGYIAFKLESSFFKSTSNG